MYSLQYDTHTIKTALVAGNYLNPTGYGYGGQRWTTSVRNLHGLLVEDLNLPVVAEKLVMIDVHSGLGDAWDRWMRGCGALISGCHLL